MAVSLEMKHRMDVEEGEAVEERDATDHLDPIAQKIEELLGDVRREFEGGVCIDKLGSKFGGYGSFLPTELRAPSVLGQAKPVAATTHISNPKNKISPSHLVEQNRRSEGFSSVTEATVGGTSLGDKFPIGARQVVSEHAQKSQNLFIGFSSKNEEIEVSAPCFQVKETNSNVKTESNIAHCVSSSDKGAVSVHKSPEKEPGTVVPKSSSTAVGDTSSKTQSSGADRDFSQMEPRKPKMLTRMKKDKTDPVVDTRRKNKPIYSGLGLNDSSSVSMDEEQEDEIYLSDAAYSSPNLSPLSMIQVVMSELQLICKPVGLCLLSPMSRLLDPPSFQKKLIEVDQKGSPTSFSSVLKVMAEPEDILEKTETLTESKVSQERDSKDSLQANPKVKTVEPRPAFGSGAPRAQIEPKESKKSVQDVDEPKKPQESPKDNKVMENVGREVVPITGETRQGLSDNENAAETSAFSLDISQQENLMQPDGHKKPSYKTLKKEKGKGKQKDRATSQAVEEPHERHTPGTSITFAKVTRDENLAVVEKGLVHQKEANNRSTDTIASTKEFVNVISHDLAHVKGDTVSGEEYGKGSSTKFSKEVSESKNVSNKKNRSPMPVSDNFLKHGFPDGKSNLAGKTTFTKRPAEKMIKDEAQFREPSKDLLPTTDQERNQKKDPSKKESKYLGLAQGKITKGVTNVVARELEHEHVATSSEYHDAAVGSFAKDTKSNKLSRKESKTAQEGAKEKNLPREVGVKITEASDCQKSNLDVSFPNSEGSKLGATTTDAIPAAAPPGTIVLDNWALCEKCKRWRLLLPEIDPDKLPKKFFCKMMNWLPGMNSCKFEQDETTNAVYAYLGIPNPYFIQQVNALATEAQPFSQPLATSMPGPPAPRDSYIGSETQEARSGTPSKGVVSKKSSGVKFPRGHLKYTSLSKKGESTLTKSRNLNQMEHNILDSDDPCEELRGHDGYDNNLRSLKAKRKQLKTGSAEKFEGVPTLKKSKIEEASNCYSLGIDLKQPEIPGHSFLSEAEGHLYGKVKSLGKDSSKSDAYCQEFKKADSSSLVMNRKKHKKEVLPDRALEHRRSPQSMMLEGQPSDKALYNSEGIDGKNHTSESVCGDVKVDRKIKLRLKRDDDSIKEATRRLEDEITTSPSHDEKRMKLTRADDWQGNGEVKQLPELDQRSTDPLVKECALKNSLQDPELVKGMKVTDQCSVVGAFKEASEIDQSYLRDIGSESLCRGTPSFVPDISYELAAKKRQRQTRSSSSLPSSSYQVSSPESSTRRYKGPVSPVESTVSSPLAKVLKADELGIGSKRSLRKDENHVLSKSLRASYFVTHSCYPNSRKTTNQEIDNHCGAYGPGWQKFRSRENHTCLPDEVGGYTSDSGKELSSLRSAGVDTTYLDGQNSWNSDHNDLSEDEGNDQRGRRSSFETKNCDTNYKYKNRRGLESQSTVKFKEKDGRNGRYDRLDKCENIRDKESNGDRGFKEGKHDKMVADDGFNGWDKKTTKQKMTWDDCGKVSLDGSHTDIHLKSSRREGDKAGSLVGQALRSVHSDGRIRSKDATSVSKQDTRVNALESVGKEIPVQTKQEDALCTASDKDLPDRFGNVENFNQKERKMGSARQLASSAKVSNTVCVSKYAESPLLPPNSHTQSEAEQEKCTGIIVPGAKTKSSDDFVVKTQNGEPLLYKGEFSKGVHEVAESGPRKTSPINGHMMRDTDGGASSLKAQPAHQASALIKEATSLKHTADRLQGSEAFCGDLYLRAALKFLQGAAFMESSQDGAARTYIQTLYSDTAKLCEYCANYYRKDMDMHATALALKCAAVARMRVLRVKNSSSAKVIAEFQSTIQLANPPLGESPSSSASDVDNLNNQGLLPDKLQITNTAKERSSLLQVSATSNIPSSAQHNPNLTRVLQDAAEMCAAFDAWMKADAAIATVKATMSDLSQGDVIKRVGEMGFSDVEVFIQLVYTALEALDR